MDNDSKPVLIDPVVRAELSQKVDQENVSHSKFFKDAVKNFYQTYIRPNYSVIICILIILCILYIRYIIVVQDRKVEEEVVRYAKDEAALRQRKEQSYEQSRIPPPPPTYMGYTAEEHSMTNGGLDAHPWHEQREDYMNAREEAMFYREMPMRNAYPEHIEAVAELAEKNNHIYNY